MNRQRGFYSSNLTHTVFTTVLLIIAIVLSFLFTITLINSVKEQKIKSNLEKKLNVVYAKVSENFATSSSLVAKAIENNNSLLEKMDIDAAIENLQQEIPNALRVIISTQVLSQIQPEAFPKINYATLDMLKNAERLKNDPKAEIHLFGHRDQYINYVHSLDKNKPHFLIISLPVENVLNNVAVSFIPEGMITLSQKAGKFSLINLKSWGSVPTSQKIISFKKTIPNSNFYVEYQYDPPFFLLRGMTFLSLIIGLVSSLLLLTAIIMSISRRIMKYRNKQKEKNAYVHIGDNEGPKNIEQTIEKHKLEKLENNMKKKEIGLDKSIFRAYDIRGIVDEALTVDAVTLIGQAIGTENIKRGKNEIVVARDGRLSGEKLLAALIAGLKKSGCNVINIGAVPTGVLYFATHHLGTGSGVMLTGSHNPPNYNGLKIMLNGETLAGKLIMNLYKSIMNEELDEGEGNITEMDIVDDYIDYIASDIQLENELKVVVDSGNGIGGEVGPQVLEEIGCEVIPLHCEIDGSFPNHHPDPSVPSNLKDLIATVKATDADIGIAFDGDADRLGVVTKNGDIIYPDRILMLFAKDVLTRQPGASIIFDVKCTGHLPKQIVKNGGLPIIWKTGHSFMKAKIKETDAALAGEMSGHFFFNERWFGFDDGIYAAARLLEILDQEDRPAQEVFDELPDSVSTPELKCHTEEGENYAFMEKFQKAASFPDANLTTIDGIRADFDNGWGLVRCSNTTPCLVLRFDADSQEALEAIQEEFREQIMLVDDTLELPF